MRWIFSLSLILSLLGTSRADLPPAPEQPTVILVIGAPGEEEFGKVFAHSAELWKVACKQGGAKCVTVGLAPTNATTDLQQLTQALGSEALESTAELWLVLIGHGTYDGKEAKFNLRGPDFSATELAGWLQPFKRPLAVLDCSASSAPFMAHLKGTNRVVITATRSGSEENYARFGNFLAEAVADPAADLDKDGQTSLLEAFLMASRRTTEFYETANRLATEHPLLDDNGDGLGTPADWFRGVRAIKKARDGASLDGFRAHQFHLVRSAQEQQLPPAQRQRRDELEIAINRLRETKAKLPEDEYYQRLEKLMLEIAHLNAPPKQ